MSRVSELINYRIDYKTGSTKVFHWLIASTAGLVAMPVAFWCEPAIAQNITQNIPQNIAQNGPITLTDGRAQVQGITAGSYSLTQLAARDHRRRLCLGYGDRQPNHVLVLSEPAPRLRVAIASSGDTTLLIQGPDGIDCNDNYRGSPDAVVTGTNWPEGTYRIWVGAFDQGDRLNYELSVFDPREANGDSSEEAN